MRKLPFPKLNFILTVIFIIIMERRLWIPEEDKIIVDLVNLHGHKKWTVIADEMKKIYPFTQRTSKQIRQRWHNHLDPHVNKQAWTEEEEHKLFQAHRKFGSKWKQIAAQLERRTDNYVKNHFYSTLRRSLRRINKYLGSKNSTNQMRTIRPSILSDLLDLSENDPQCRILVSRIFQFATIKPNKASNLDLMNEKEKQKFHTAITKLIEINDVYTEGKNKRVKRKSLKTLNLPLHPENSRTNEEETIEVSITKNQQQEVKNSEGEVGSWNEQTPIYNHGHMLPEIQNPEYECELLSKREVQEEENLENFMGQTFLFDTVTLFSQI